MLIADLVAVACTGYQEGEGLGLSSKGGAQPLDINLKAGRSGLGVDEAKKRKLEQGKDKVLLHCALSPVTDPCALSL